MTRQYQETGSWLGFAWWLGLAVVGGIAQLLLIHAGPSLHYQHYQLYASGTGQLHLVPLLVLLVQTIIVAGVAAASARGWWSRCRQTLGRWGVLLLVSLAAVAAAPVAREYRAFLVEVPAVVLLQVVQLLTLVFAIRAAPRRWALIMGDLIARWSAAGRSGLDWVYLAGAAWVLALSALLNLVVYQNHPHVPDEVAYVYQARIFAAGEIRAPAPPVPPAFDVYLMDRDHGLWWSSFPPGWSVVLAMGMLVHLPWLVNPVLAAIGIVLAGVLIERLYCRATARLVVLLMSTSPWLIFIAMSYMSHALSLVIALAGALMLHKAWAGRAWLWALAAGLAVGLLLLVRPLEAAIMGIMLALFALRGVRAAPLTRLLGVAALCLGAFLSGCITLAYNQYMTGRYDVFPVNAYLEKHWGPHVNDLGFGPDRGMGWQMDAFPGHSPLEAAINTDLNLHSVGTELHGWVFGSLLAIGYLLVARRLCGIDWVMLTFCLAVVAFHGLYWYSGGPDFGARYWFLAFVPLLVLSARGIEAFSKALSEQAGAVGHGRVGIALAVLCGMALLIYVPWRALDKYQGYLGMDPQVRQMASKLGWSRDLVLVRGAEHPDYASAFAYNPVDFSQPEPVYAHDIGRQSVRELIQAMPDRRVWIIDGPSITKKGYVVIAGPLPATDAVAAAARASDGTGDR